MRAGIVVICCALLLGCGGSSSDDPPAPPAPPAGLDARAANLTCIAPDRTGGAGATIALQRAFPSLSFEQPLAMLQAPGDDSRWFVLEKGSGANVAAATARVRVFSNTDNVSSLATFVTLTVNADSEGGLLGMAFHPDWATNRHVFLSFTEGAPMVSVIARFTSADGGLTLDPASRQDVLRVNQPYGNHNGGQIAFDAEGHLYVGFGDGGNGGDPDGRAQDTTDLLGDILRIDVDAAAPYAIPPDNPFAGGPLCTPNSNVSAGNCPEIYAWGFRNPWRFSFDSATGDLWVGDVGQNSLEEVDRVQRGGNYGWDCREGTSVFGSPAPSCGTATGLVDPVHEYDRSLGTSITGGFVYRGTTLPALAGTYLFADFGSGRIWRLVEDGSGGYDAEELLDTSLSIASFGQGNDGELYVVDLAGGALHRLVDGGGAATPGPAVPALLSDTGCVDPQNSSAPAGGLVPYEPAAPFWSDNATKERWLAIPDGTAIGVEADGDFMLPNGTVLMKHFRLNGTLIETRLFMRHPDGQWAGYTYEWNGQRTDAALVEGGKAVAIGSQSWLYPSGNDCLACHTAAAGFALGLESAQLNRELTYPGTGRTANQLRTLDHIAMFEAPLGDPGAQPSMPQPFDAAAPLAARARAYLHTNCAHCHRPSGPAPSALDLRYATLLSSTAACDAPPQSGDLGLGAAARIVAPGNPDASVLPARMGRRDASAMPPIASNVVDADGVALIREWIAALTSCL